ncbi:hypothetical protein AAI421_17945 [Rhodococcus aetherivorans]
MSTKLSAAALAVAYTVAGAAAAVALTADILVGLVDRSTTR